MKQVEIRIALFEAFKSEEYLILDKEESLIADDECDRFKHCDTDEHECFVDTHREEREATKVSVLSTPRTVVHGSTAECKRSGVFCSLTDFNLDARQRFFESMGLEAALQDDVA